MLKHSQLSYKSCHVTNIDIYNRRKVADNPPAKTLQHGSVSRYLVLTHAYTQYFKLWNKLHEWTNFGTLYVTAAFRRFTLKTCRSGRWVGQLRGCRAAERRSCAVHVHTRNSAIEIDTISYFIWPETNGKFKERAATLPGWEPDPRGRGDHFPTPQHYNHIFCIIGLAASDSLNLSFLQQIQIVQQQPKWWERESQQPVGLPPHLHSFQVLGSELELPVCIMVIFLVCHLESDDIMFGSGLLLLRGTLIL